LPFAYFVTSFETFYLPFSSALDILSCTKLSFSFKGFDFFL